jgi:hypothetical protein
MTPSQRLRQRLWMNFRQSRRLKRRQHLNRQQNLIRSFINILYVTFILQNMSRI